MSRFVTFTLAFLCTLFGFSISMRPCAPPFFCSSSDSLSEASLLSALPDSSSPLSSEPDSSWFFFLRHFLDSSDFLSSSSCSGDVKWRFLPLWFTNFPKMRRWRVWFIGKVRCMKNIANSMLPRLFVSYFRRIQFDIAQTYLVAFWSIRFTIPINKKKVSTIALYER